MYFGNPCGESPLVVRGYGSAVDLGELYDICEREGVAMEEIACHFDSQMREISNIDWGVGRNTKLTNQEKMNPKNIKRVIFNHPATIVLYNDDTKYIVKCNNEDFDQEKGLAMVFMNLAFDDNRSERRRFVDNAISENTKEEIEQ